ncbi:MAG: nucleotidyltransferase family protein [Rhizobiaceae bacterium]|jgi:molybdenum cofactor cytidylyltransferase|nr:nucleotidyltransferase family protein [Rhizobiaceae bacterium]
MTEIALVLMAAGNARRMGGANKLLTPWRGAPLASHAATAARSARSFAHRILVTGRDGDAVADAAGPDFIRVHNPRHAEGFGTSLAAALRHVLADHPATGGVLIMLADMPLVTGADCDALAGAFAAETVPSVIRASCKGKPGNPVILPRLLFDAISALDGDESAKPLIAASGLATHLVEIGDQAVIDFDTLDAFTRHA